MRISRNLPGSFGAVMVEVDVRAHGEDRVSPRAGVSCVGGGQDGSFEFLISPGVGAFLIRSRDTYMGWTHDLLKGRSAALSDRSRTHRLQASCGTFTVTGMLSGQRVKLPRLRLFVDSRLVATADGIGTVDPAPWNKVAFVVSAPGSDIVFDDLLVRAR